jgi:hypothetical protein
MKIRGAVRSYYVPGTSDQDCSARHGSPSKGTSPLWTIPSGYLLTVCHGKKTPFLSSVNHLFRLGPWLPWRTVSHNQMVHKWYSQDFTRGNLYWKYHEHIMNMWCWKTWGISLCCFPSISGKEDIQDLGQWMSCKNSRPGWAWFFWTLTLQDIQIPQGGTQTKQRSTC